MLATKPVRIFGDHADNTLAQLEACMTHERAVAGALLADGHLGYAMPIGGVIAYDGAVSPTGVGFDIACGNAAVRTSVLADDLEGKPHGWSTASVSIVKSVMREIQRRVEFGLGKKSAEPVEHELFDDPLWHELGRAFGVDLEKKAREQLGTVGAGNHYVDLLADEAGFVWVANHFGSRGFGHTVASGFMAAARGQAFTERLPESEESIVLETDSELGMFYVEAMALAGRYAYAGRDHVIDQVLAVLGNPKVTERVHCHHNFAWYEDGLWYVRKGATPLTRELAFIGGTMGEGGVVVRGQTNLVAGEDYVTVQDIGALGSAPHGAGRAVSRTKAAGKMRKMVVCTNRDCDYAARPNEHDETAPCPRCGGERFKRVRMRDPSTALIDWQAERAKLAEQGVVVLGAGADEAPPAYKRLAEVLEYHPNVEVVQCLRPLGVIMAPAHVYDPYRDS